MKRLLSLLILQIFVALAIAQDENPIVTLESPYNTIYSHLYYLQPNSYFPDSAAKTIHNISDKSLAAKRAIQLKQVLDGKGLYVQINLLPQEADYIDSTKTQRALYTPFPVQLPELYLEKVDDKWYYSKETIDKVPQLHKEVYPFGTDVLLNFLPKTGQNKILGLAIWQYLGLALLIVLGFVFHFILRRILNPIVARLSRSKVYPSLISPELIHRIASLLSVLVIIRLIRIFIPLLALPVTVAKFVFLVITVITTILLLLIALRILDVFMAYGFRLTQRTESKLDEQLIPIIKRSIQAVLVIGAIIQILNVLDVNVTALIAGISIGGLALALAAQDTVKNLIGSAMIFVDQPFQIGDYITVGSFSGTVTEVGFRTTRIRLLDSSIISIPNGTIANQAVTNLGVRVLRIFQTTIGLTYDTPPSLIKKYMEGLKKIAETHHLTQKDAIIVNLTELGSSSINIMFRAPLLINDYTLELNAKQELLLAIIQLAESLGVRFAFPSTTMYVEDFPGKLSNIPKYETAEEKVDQKIETFIQSFKAEIDKTTIADDPII